MTIDFREILSSKLDDVKRPPPLPAGTYEGIIKEHRLDKSNEKQTPFAEFTFQITAPGKDISADELDGIDLSKKSLKKAFYFTKDSLWRFKEFVQALGIDVHGKDIDQILPETTGLEVLLEVTQRVNKNRPTDPPFNDVGEVKGL